jgi:hypothetical protein
MSGLRKQGEKIRQFIIDNVEHNPKDIASVTAKAFSLTRQAVNKHIRFLVNQKSLIAHGTTRNRHYRLHQLVQWDHIYSLDSKLEEDVVWRKDIVELLGEMPDNVLDIWHYGFTEMFNNAIDHSSGKSACVQLKKTATSTEIMIYDNGEGIFKKIQRELDLHDERHAVLELSKGKLTTDQQKNQTGTGVFMTLRNNTSRTTKKIFDKFTSDEDYGFSKTVVPVRLAQYGNEKLISRSQAKRLLARVDKFKVVIFDFDEVDGIGQAFADEVFRVFVQKNPQIELVPIKTNKIVKQMISRVLKHIES